MSLRKFLAVFIMVLCLCCLCSVSVFAAVDEDVDRNDYSQDTALGTNDTAHVSSSDTSDSSDDSETKPEDLLSEDEITEAEKYQSRSSFVDSVIYFTGVFIWIFGTIWVSFAVLDKIAPFLTSPVVKFITRGEKVNLSLSMGAIVVRFIMMSVIGTLFVTGWVKVWLGSFFGWVLSR